MLLDLLFLLLPLIVGYVIPSLPGAIERILDRSLTALIYFILVLMGASLAGLPDLGPQLGSMGWYAIVLAALLFIFNLIAIRLAVGRKKHRAPQQASSTRQASSLAPALRSASILIIAVAIGVAAGLILPALAHHAQSTVGILLYILLGLVGHQLRQANISLRQMMMNIEGIKIALAVTCSSLLAGLCAALLLTLPLPTGLALSSGFGWYSLSTVLLGNELGAFYGGLALCNDLMRELVALLLMPMLFTHFPAAAIGYCGATAMDVTLPMIRRQGGIACVPPALISGFILSLFAPLLMMTFLAFIK